MQYLKIIGLWVCLLAFSGCAVFDPPQFKPTRYNLDLQIKIIPTEDFSALAKKYGFDSLGGMTEYVDFKGKCKLYIPMLKEARDSYTMCVAGHELFECIFTGFHKKGEGESCRSQQ